MLNIVEIITKKKNNQPLSEQEIKYVYEGFVNKEIKDYQMAAFLMAVNFNGYNDQEQYFATKAMIESGTTIDLRLENEIVVDKHSSGGVGDKVSIIMTPLLAALGLCVGKMSGRGLGHTGGTIDKLESLKLNLDFDLNTYKQQLEQTHLLLTGQSDSMVVADKEIYALRDVTGTSDVFDLIAGSIMSKKLALITDYIFLDIKVGDGAFCKTVQQGEQLANKMIQLSKQFNRKTIIHLTNMDQPLGQAIGNAIEVKESVDYLLGKKVSDDLYNLINTFLIDILLATKKANNQQEAQALISEVIASKKGFDKFVEWVRWMNGDVDSLLNDTYFNPAYKVDLYAKEEGYLDFVSTKELGMINVDLKAGRKTKTDQLDYHAGIYLHKKTNDYLKVGDHIATLYASDPINESVCERFYNNLVYNQKPKTVLPIIIKVIE
ncbi:thymidine phosphorylase [Ureaplasma diversum]|uniref:Thymidine phosphorylase n=1 Tax=Ureaplasma diversum NCTC 246 TaxID=1188241 RepID=A0A084F053_9BACT|nr:thymidine phosphorylase [Ureaplasma diversum]KEZ23595.1 Thymidine phosphorylase [Ureaplasma diversum NCTC 246]